MVWFTNSIGLNPYIYANHLMKKFLFLLLLGATSLCYGQDYVDLFVLNYGQTSETDFEDGTGSTSRDILEATLTIPIPINENHAIITGLDFNQSNLEVSAASGNVNLYSTTLQLGWSGTINEKWSATVVMLPKIASDYEQIDGDDFYFGGFGILKLKKRENFFYKFGAYASSEAFGVFAVPIVGLYYLSPNEKFEANVSFPIAVNMNYKLGDRSKLGLDYVGIGRSFRLTTDGQKDTYIQQGNLEFAAYYEYGLFNNTILLRLMAGYVTNDFELYNENETYDLGLAAFRFGDDRTQLNADIDSGFYAKVGLRYRFYLNKDKEETP